MSTTAGSGVEVAAIDTPALGDRSYLAHDGDIAVVVDPQRDIDRSGASACGCLDSGGAGRDQGVHHGHHLREPGRQQCRRLARAAAKDTRRRRRPGARTNARVNRPLGLLETGSRWGKWRDRMHPRGLESACPLHDHEEARDELSDQDRRRCG